MEEAIFDKDILLERFDGKGGWTYARLDEIPPNKKNPFGWRRVRGFIDDYEIRAYHLMPMGLGQLFLPVKAEIRKAINKKAGDTVHILLFMDDLPIETPGEFMECLEDSSEALKFYQKLTEAEKKRYVEWIYSAKTETTRVKRLANAITYLEKGKRV